MDFLGFFKGKMYFLKFKKLNPTPNQSQPQGISGSRVRLGPLRPARWLARHWPPHGIRRRAVRHGAVQARVWPWAGEAGRSGSGRIGCGHAGMWPPMHRPVLCKRLRT
jgi:hypothetical protein